MQAQHLLKHFKTSKHRACHPSERIRIRIAPHENTTATVGACIVTMGLGGIIACVCIYIYTYTYTSDLKELQRNTSRECPGVDSTGYDAAPATTGTITTSINLYA